MQFTLLMVAAAIAMVGAIFHGYVGGRLYMKNIRESQLASLTQSLSLVSWQMFTVLLLVSDCVSEANWLSRMFFI